MTAHAKRRKRRRRIAVAAAFVVLLAVLTVIGSFWRQSEREALRAEAAELVALGQLELESYPSATVAHAIASLELSDSRAAWRLALEALGEGPTVFVVSEQPTLEVGFTSDGRWLTQRFFAPGEGPIRLIGEDGSIRPLPETDGQGGFSRSHAGARNDLFVLRDLDLDRQSGAMITKRVRLWSASECSVIAEAPYDQRVLGASVIPDERRVLVFVSEGQGRLSVDTLSFDGDLSRLGALDFEIEADGGSWHGSWDAHEARIIATSTGHDIFVTGIEDAGLSRPRLLGTENATVASLAVDPQGRFVASATVNGDVRLWPLTGGPPTDRVPGPPEARVFFTEDGEFLFCRRWASANGNPTHDEHQFWIWAVESDGLTFLRSTDVGLPAPKSFLNVDGDGRRFVRTGGDQVIRLWRRAAPADAEPVELLRGGVLQVYMPEFHPDGRWLAVADSSGLGLWPLARPYPIVLRQHTNAVSNVLFAPDGGWLASASSDGTARLWPLDGVAPEPGREVLDPAEFAFFSGLATDSVGG